MTYRTLLVVVLLLAGCAGESAIKSHQSDPNLRAVEDYQYNRADSNFANVIKQDSTSPTGYYGLGYSAEHQLFYFDAIANYLRALQHASDYAPALAGLARCYARMGADFEAVDAARRYTALAKTDPQAWILLADNLIAARQFADVASALQQAEAAGVSADLMNLVKARAALLQGDQQTGEQLVRQIRKPDLPEVAMALADYLEAKGLCDSSMTVSRAAFKRDDNHEMLVEHFFRSLRTGYAHEARQLIAEMSRRDKSTVLASVARYYYFSAVGDRRRAAAATDDLSTSRPGAFSTYAYQFTAHDRMNDGIGASAIADELGFAVEQQRLPAHFNAFMSSYVASMRTLYMAPPHAKMILDSLVDPAVRSELMYQITYAQALYRGHGIEGFDSLYAQYLGERMENASFLSGVGAIRALISRTQIGSADSMFQLALAADKNDLPSFQRWLEMHLRWNDWHGIQAAFDQYPQFAERYPAMGLLRAASLAWLGRADEAVTQAAKSLPQAQGNSALLNLAVRGLVVHRHFEQAKAIVTQALELQKDNPDILAAAAYAHGEMGDWQQAKTFADRGLSTEPNHPWLMAEKARALAQNGKADEATRIFDTLAVDMANTEGLLYYSQMLVQAKKDTARAQDLARQASYTGQLYFRATQNLANVYLATGRPDLARGVATVAIKTMPDDAEAYYLLGMALFTEKNAQAREVLQRAIDLGLTGDQLQQAQTALTRI